MPARGAANVPAIYEDFRPGTYDQTARLADMDANHVEAAINYPNTFPRFAGQGFAERSDKDLALACLQIYNDWMIDDWCGGDAAGRLIPLTLVPLWDPSSRPRRCGAARPRAATPSRFTENPSKLGFPSLLQRRVGRAVGRLPGDRHDGVDAHRLVVVDADHLPGRAARPRRCR